MTDSHDVYHTEKGKIPFIKEKSIVQQVECGEFFSFASEADLTERSQDLVDFLQSENNI
ncbi:MAG: hypothetical protein QM666_02005 [Acinetobacter sp.]